MSTATKAAIAAAPTAGERTRSTPNRRQSATVAAVISRVARGVGGGLGGRGGGAGRGGGGVAADELLHQERREAGRARRQLHCDLG